MSANIKLFWNPLDDVDEFVFFAQSLQELGNKEKAFAEHWSKNMSDRLYYLRSGLRRFRLLCSATMA